MAFPGNLAELLTQKQGTLKPTETKVTTLLQAAPHLVDQDKPEGELLGLRGYEDPTEYFDTPEQFQTKVMAVAEILRKAKHVVVYTGAGISTGAGAALPDYRGSEGLWTLKDQGLKSEKSLTSLESCLPTFGHMALVALMKAGFVHYVVSTNLDGLHMHSGIPRDKLAELHGNAYLEKCKTCKTPFLRDFDVTTTGAHNKTHLTGRKCEVSGCPGDLLDSIIDFGEDLPEIEFLNATTESKRGDVALVLGTSMHVVPSNTLPSFVYQTNGGVLIICNLQLTQFNKFATQVVHGYTDDFLALLTKELGVNVELKLPKGDRVAPAFVDRINETYPEKHRISKEQGEAWQASKVKK